MTTLTSHSPKILDVLGVNESGGSAVHELRREVSRCNETIHRVMADARVGFLIGLESLPDRLHHGDQGGRSRTKPAPCFGTNAKALAEQRKYSEAGAWRMRRDSGFQDSRAPIVIGTLVDRRSLGLVRHRVSGRHNIGCGRGVGDWWRRVWRLIGGLRIPRGNCRLGSAAWFGARSTRSRSLGWQCRGVRLQHRHVINAELRRSDIMFLGNLQRTRRDSPFGGDDHKCPFVAAIADQRRHIAHQFPLEATDRATPCAADIVA